MDTSGAQGNQEWRDTRLTQFRIWFRDQATISCAFSVAKNKQLRLSDSDWVLNPEIRVLRGYTRVIFFSAIVLFFFFMPSFELQEGN